MKYIYILTLLIFVSCDNESLANEPSYEELVEQGWNAFESGSYKTAVDKFTTALEKNSSDNELVIVLGWSLMLDQQLDRAMTKLQNLSLDHADVYAGIAFIGNALGSFENSNSHIDKVLATEPEWSFGHGLNLSKTDLFVIQAQNYFSLNNYSKSLDTIKKIDSTFSIDISTYEGKQSLAKKIEQLNKGIVQKHF